MEDGPSGKIVRALVPLAEMFGYATSCVLLPRVALHAMEFAKYHDAPTNVAQAVIEERKSKYLRFPAYDGRRV
jgi:elongation factor G